ncbi:hypothetical protein [Streptomyces sp. NPDC049881]|uniref:hypothetical protein n=1 Tax=unclassified Streptomyces TaxID=2593676 RepID=UPI00342EDD78
METVTRVPAGERGTTRVSERVVAKLAAQAAWEALTADRSGPPPPPRHDGHPLATAVVRRPPGAAGDTGASAVVRVELELGYPCDIGARCRAVRQHIAARLGELAGMATADVAVTVTRLHSRHSAAPGGPGRRRVL